MKRNIKRKEINTPSDPSKSVPANVQTKKCSNMKKFQIENCSN
jgi:hypothetical protein